MENKKSIHPKNPSRIALIGSATIDRIEQHGIRFIKAGGVVTYAGITFQKQGFPPVVVSNIAIQDESLINIFHQHHIKLFNGVTQATTRFINHLEGDERWQEMPIQATPITANQAQRVIEQVDHIHLGPLHPFDIEMDLLRLVAKKQQLVTLDVQGYVRQVEESAIQLKVSEHLHEALLCSCVIKTGRKELDAILDFYQMDIEELKNTYRLSEVIITDGGEGGRVVTKSGVEVNYTAKQVDHVIDSTGAGDVFFAAYLVSRFYHNRSIGESCKHASLVSARHVEGHYISKEELSLQ